MKSTLVSIYYYNLLPAVFGIVLCLEAFRQLHDLVKTLKKDAQKIKAELIIRGNVSKKKSIFLGDFISTFLTSFFSAPLNRVQPKVMVVPPSLSVFRVQLSVGPT